MDPRNPLPTEPFEALLFQEELEERVEFAEWTISAECETDFDGNSSCSVGVETTIG